MGKKSSKKPAKKVKPSPSADAVSLPEDTPERTISTWWILFAVGIIVIVLALVVRSTQTPETYEYEGFRFTEVPCPGGTCWQTGVVTNVGVREVIFYNGPRDVEDVIVDPRAVRKVTSLSGNPEGQVIITFEDGVPGEIGVAAANIARITGERVYNIPTRGAVYGDVTCSDASNTTTVINMVQGEPAGVGVLENGCVLLVAPTAEEVLRVADAYVLHLLQVME